MDRKPDETMEILSYESDNKYILSHDFGEIYYQMHWHHAVEIIMPINGSLTVDLNTDAYQLNESDIFIVPPCQLHSLKSDHEDGQRIILIFDLQILNNIQGLLNTSAVYASPQLITSENTKDLHAYIQKRLLYMLDESLCKEPYYEVNILCKLFEISVHLSREQSNGQSDDYSTMIMRRQNAAKLNDCINYINTHYKDNITLDMAADASGFSKYHFTRWFKQNSGVSFFEYLNKVRIKKAEALLIHSAKPITEIALESGFQSIVTFNRVFKKYTKTTPTEYCNLHKVKAPQQKGCAIINNDTKYDLETQKHNIMKVAPYITTTPLIYNLPGSSLLSKNNKYSTPYIWTDIPDPDVIRVNDTYYMVSTTMHFTPHCPIMKSTDLVNWEIVNYVCDILDDSDASSLRNESHAYGKGTWAASIRYHKETYYVTVASYNTGKTYIFQAEDIENGPWRKYEINHVHHDQSLLFDDDGRVYMVSGAGCIYLIELTSNATSVKEGGLDRVIIKRADVGGQGGLPAEGSHFYKINGRYYLFLIAWPPTGSGRRIELCYRADHIEGPYEGRVILDEDIGFKNMGVAQGGIIDTPTGDWYAVLFQDRASVGRIPVLIPMTWEDGWPVLNVKSTAPIHINLPDLRNKANGIVSSDEFYQYPITKNYTAVNDIRYLYDHLDDVPVLNSDKQDTELLVNNNFENGTEHWDNTYIASLNIVYDETLGKSVLLISDRVVTASGPKQDLSDKLVPGGVYEVSARVKYMTGPPEKQFIISLYRGEGWETIQNMGSAIIKKGEWNIINGTYTLPIDSDLPSPSIFIETPWISNPKKGDDLMDFYVDFISMIEKPMMRKIKTAAFENAPNDSRLSLIWQWNHNPDHNLWSLTERPGYLRLKSGYLCNELTDARNTLTQRTFGPVCSGTVALDTSGMKDGDFAGIAALQEIYGFVGVKVENQNKSIIMVNTASGSPNEIESIPLISDTIYLRIDFDFTDTIDQARFYYSEDEIYWYPIGDVLHMEYKLTHFTGYRFALFYFATQIVGGYADFDYFRISDHITEHTNYTILNASLDKQIEALGTPNTFISLPIRMDALPDGSYSSIDISLTIPELLNVEGVSFSNHNIVGDTHYEFTNNRLQLFVTGEPVNFTHNTSQVFAVIRLNINNFIQENTQLHITTDYIHVNGGGDDHKVAYRTHEVKTTIKLTALQTKSKAKLPGLSNPLINHKYGADPWALEYDGRLYVYLSGDKYQYNNHGRLINNTYKKINTIAVISSTDMLNWTDHGEIPVAGSDGVAKWASCSWAPAVTYKSIQGKDQFFLYFSNGASNIGVLTSKTPTGPWTDVLGAPLIHKGIPGVKDVVNCSDPAVLVDEDGTSYLYFGGGLPSRSQKDALNPRTARVIKLGDDMISTVGKAVMIDAPAFLGDSGIHKFKGKYYYSYCSNSAVDHPNPKPAHGEIAYMVGESPMGPFTYVGTILKKPASLFRVGGNNHHCIFTFKEQWYIAYHSQTLGKARRKVKGYRSPHITKLDITFDGRIKPVEMDMKSVTLPVPLTLNPYKQTGAETFAWQAGINTDVISGCTGLCVTDIHDGDWLAVANINFGADGATKVFVRVASKTGGEIEIRLDSPQGKIVCVLGVGSTGSYDNWQVFSSELSRITGVHHVFFVFKGDNEYNLLNFDCWWFE